ncbi:UNVERIFIED_CONTAM: hypothetical protein FKN15_068034 [Acipenser sinensis]
MSNRSEVSSEDFDTSNSDADLSLSDYDEEDVEPTNCKNRRACSYFTADAFIQGSLQRLGKAFPRKEARAETGQDQGDTGGEEVGGVGGEREEELVPAPQPQSEPVLIEEAAIQKETGAEPPTPRPRTKSPSRSLSLTGSEDNTANTENGEEPFNVVAKKKRFQQTAVELPDGRAQAVQNSEPVQTGRLRAPDGESVPPNAEEENTAEASETGGPLIASHVIVKYMGSMRSASETGGPLITSHMIVKYMGSMRSTSETGGPLIASHVILKYMRSMWSASETGGPLIASHVIVKYMGSMWSASETGGPLIASHVILKYMGSMRSASETGGPLIASHVILKYMGSVQFQMGGSTVAVANH